MSSQSEVVLLSVNHSAIGITQNVVGVFFYQIWDNELSGHFFLHMIRMWVSKIKMSCSGTTTSQKTHLQGFMVVDIRHTNKPSQAISIAVYRVNVGLPDASLILLSACSVPVHPLGTIQYFSYPLHHLTVHVFRIGKRIIACLN